jgi:hypothetical protein
MPAAPAVVSSVLSPATGILKGTHLTWTIVYMPGESDKTDTEAGTMTDSLTGLSAQTTITFSIADDVTDATSAVPSATDAQAWTVASNAANGDGTGHWTAVLTATAA